MARRGGLRWLLATAAGAACVLPARADFVDDYALGLKAIDEGRYREALGHLEAALKVQAEPVSKIMLNGAVEQPYLPYHFIGIADYRLGDCDAARAAWDNPTNQRMVGRLNAIRRLEQRLAGDCKPRVADAAEKPEAPVAPAPAPADEAPAKPVPAPAPGPARADEGGAPRPAPAAPEPARPAGAAESQPPPAPLLRAFEAYATGRYAELERIAPDSLPAPRARFHSYLLRAAARFSAAQLASDQALLANARADARAAQALDRGAEPDPDVFSPKFRAFYAQARR